MPRRLLGIGLVNGLLVTASACSADLDAGDGGIRWSTGRWVYTNGAPNGSMPDLLQHAANGKLGSSVADIIVALVFAAVLVLLTRTVFGRQLYAVGANPRTTLTTASGSSKSRSSPVLCGTLAAAASCCSATHRGQR